ncbi:helix-turn-helix domain-containing protein [Nocardia sp. CDC153]|uniref:GlxA family transcriptional regulator n=1 Tax=Nocardia sp. CDC153 TaxID=3112167 RepID=UPI002DBFBBC5|nr:helix-turn-helix domain-containing protein [Nocardia sp. CDC153]MEC3953959.1 helix-turn-helix domain-containing protein [Nocardia sp. CDC153]
MPNASTPHLVAVLVVEPTVGFDMAIPPVVLGAAADEDGNPLYEVHTCGVSTGGVAATTGYTVIPEYGPELLARADTVIVPGTRIPGPRQTGELPADLTAALATIRPDARIVSICTGAFVLGAAGILDGRRATTHWQFADRFRALYPNVLLDENQLFIADGNVWSSAGLAAGIDLCLHLIRTDHGSAVANGAARYCVVPPWREGGQSQFIERQVPEAGSDGTAPTRRWALHHLDRDLDLNSLAAHAHMSVRTFTRRFKAETGMAPGAWILQQRIRHARHLLETTDLPIDEVARSAGMGTSASLRHHMRLELGVPPLAYRKTFRKRETLETA